jgi:hypothetical protein
MLTARAVGWAFAAMVAGCSPDRSSPPLTSNGAAARPRGQTARLTRAEVIAARKKYDVHVVSFDASQGYGVELPYADLVRLRIINRASVALPQLTVLTKRYDARGRMVGSSRKPSIAVADLQPGDTAELDYYPRRHLPGVKRIAVEVEDLIDPEEEHFFPELQSLAP